MSAPARPSDCTRCSERAASKREKAPGQCDLRRVPRDLCVWCPSTTYRPVRRLVKHDLSRPCSLRSLRCPTTVQSLSKSSPIEPRQAHVPSVCVAPRQAPRHTDEPTSGAIRSRRCFPPDGVRPTLVSFAFDAALPHARTPPPSVWVLARLRNCFVVLVRLRRALRSVLGEMTRTCSLFGPSAPHAHERLPARPPAVCLARRSALALDEVHRNTTPSTGQERSAKSTGHPPLSAEIPSNELVSHSIVHNVLHSTERSDLTTSS